LRESADAATRPAAARCVVILSEEWDMDENRMDGAARSLAGHAKDAVGNLTGDTKLQAEGQADKAIGQAQDAAGQLADTIRDQPITALLIAAGFGYLLGRLGRYI
jgi:uncharacterized protein YjbJ (UPF0337 family)